ncbi:MAG TPA: hypothetical protein VFG54_12090 [Prolixibacteraceae bacterium]|nr:hypothetical protein [Prolixibacteraceae bacterium]
MPPEIIYSIIGTFIMILLYIISYGVKQWIQTISKQWTESIKALSETITDLKTAVALLQNNQTHSDKADVEKHEIIDNRLNDHARTLKDHDKKLTRLETIVQNK